MWGLGLTAKKKRKKKHRTKRKMPFLCSYGGSTTQNCLLRRTSNRFPTCFQLRQFNLENWELSFLPLLPQCHIFISAVTSYTHRKHTHTHTHTHIKRHTGKKKICCQAHKTERERERKSTTSALINMNCDALFELEHWRSSMYYM